jgi:hypothetical protein
MGDDRFEVDVIGAHGNHRTSHLASSCANGQKLKCLTVVDEWTRAQRGFPAARLMTCCRWRHAAARAGAGCTLSVLTKFEGAV